MYHLASPDDIRPMPRRAHASVPGNDSDTIRKRLEPVLARDGDVAFAYLFGSAVKGSLRASSDVDVAVSLTSGEGAAGRLERALRLEGDLEAVVDRTVQVVVLNDAPLELRRNVLGHGELLCVRDDALRHAFYVDTGRRYYDMEHARRIFRARRDRRIREGRFGG